jgi:hypothetical protein
VRLCGSRPGQVAIAGHHRVRRSQFSRFLRVQGGVNATENYVSSAGARLPADFIAPQGVGGVNADAHRVAALDGFKIDFFQSFIHQQRIAKLSGRGSSQHIEPTGGDNSSTEGDVARINKVHLHSRFSLSDCKLGQAQAFPENTSRIGVLQ